MTYLGKYTKINKNEKNTKLGFQMNGQKNLKREKNFKFFVEPICPWLVS